MAINVTIDTKEVGRKLAELAKKSQSAALKASSDIAEEILRLSSFEVPHDIGLLQNSGHVEPEPGGHIVGYNKVYAARLHENPQYRFQKGRKGKYLEDPIKNNTHQFRSILESEMRAIL